MDKESFMRLFVKNVDAAIMRAEEILNRKLTRNMVFELHGVGHSGVRLLLDEVLSRIYISDTEFYRIIDILVKTVTVGEEVIFVRVSEYKPEVFEKTWNTPDGNGPFRVLEPVI